ncbi:hypothetical protein, partial [Roseibium sp.]|uniref:hypothetical protein n=1 Tax=Roseibium sp. TaxID=1936156 RepID=UPI0025CCB2B9
NSYWLFLLIGCANRFEINQLNAVFGVSEQSALLIARRKNHWTGPDLHGNRFSSQVDLLAKPMLA